MVQWNSNLLEKYIAPEISTFVNAEIPDVSDLFPESQYWLQNHFLNTVFGAKFKEKWRQVAIGFLRRSQNSFTSYHKARELTLEYLDNNDPLNPKISKYYLAVSEWENYALQVSMGIDLFKWLNMNQGAFEKNDGSIEQRLYTIANHVKHTASCVNSGQSEECHTIPLWLNNEGIMTYDLSVTYKEASEVLIDISKLADEYQNPSSFIKEKT